MRTIESPMKTLETKVTGRPMETDGWSSSNINIVQGLSSPLGQPLRRHDTQTRPKKKGSEGKARQVNGFGYRR